MEAAADEHLYARGSANGSANGEPRVSDVERKSFLRAYSRKSIESNPEDEEFVVGDDGMINVIAVDDRTRIERLRQLLDKKERETRQAAEYGLSLLESNEELQLEIEALKIQHEGELADMAAERDLFRRRHELAQQEIEGWKNESKRHEEGKYQLTLELETLAGRNASQRDDSSSSQQQSRIQELEDTLSEMRATEQTHTTVIAALKKWKHQVESMQKESEVATETDHLYTQRLEIENEKLRHQVEQLAGDKTKLQHATEGMDEQIKSLRKEMDALHEKLASKRSQLHAQAELLLTAESKCGRLERERMIMEQVANLPVAVFDRDDDEDDDDDDDDEEDDDDLALKSSPREQPSNQENGSDNDPASDEDWFTPPNPSNSKRRGSAIGQFQLPGVESRVPTTPSSVATHQKLHHYFHLTALSIIHENNLLERCFDSSSRATIDMWYREVVDQGLQFLEWHAWLIDRIGGVAATIDSDERAVEASNSRRGKRSSVAVAASSPFKKLMQRPSGLPPVQNPMQPPSRPPPTPRVSSSVAWSFFSRLVGRKENSRERADT